MEDKIFLGTVWNNGSGSYGLRVGKHRGMFFSEKVKKINLIIGNRKLEYNLSDSFWRKCPEIRMKEIKEWLQTKNKRHGDVLFKVVAPYRTFKIFDIEE